MANIAQPESEVHLTLKKKIFFSLVLLSILGTALEVGSTMVLKATRGFDGVHLLQYEFDPYKSIRLQPGFEDTRGVKHNLQGFRHPEEVLRKKPANTYRIFLLGGSTAYGLGGLWPHIQTEFAVIPDSATISSYLAQNLGKSVEGMEIEVINAAVPSIWTHHHLININQTILGFDPDMILFLDGYNDFYFHDPEHDQFATYAYQEHSATIMGPPTLKSLAFSNFWWFARRSSFVHLAGRSARTFKAVISGTPDAPPIDLEYALPSIQKVFSKNALKMIERTALILEHEDVHGVFLNQPMLVLEGNRDMPAVERDLFAFNIESYSPNYQELMVRSVPGIVDQEREAVESLGGTFIDLTRIYEGVEGQIFTDYAHLTPLGNRLLAARVADEILPLIEADLGIEKEESSHEKR